jgi:hypothetical protein
MINAAKTHSYVPRAIKLVDEKKVLRETIDFATINEQKHYHCEKLPYNNPEVEAELQTRLRTADRSPTNFRRNGVR